MTDERKLKLEKISLFKSNKLAYMLTLLSTVTELIHTVMILDVIESNNLVFIVVMLNITMLFGIFYIAVKENVYSRKASIAAIILAAYILFRTFYAVPNVLRPASKSMTLLALDLITTALLIVGAVITIDISKRREKHIQEAI